jgi:hypothetical protein
VTAQFQLECEGFAITDRAYNAAIPNRPSRFLTMLRFVKLPQNADLSPMMNFVFSQMV